MMPILPLLLGHGRPRGAHALARTLPMIAALVISAHPINAQWSTSYDQFYRQASHNWQFRRNYPSADRLFNAFDYGHAILYERLLTKPNAPVALLEERDGRVRLRQ